jgi:hypothetical protein
VGVPGSLPQFNDLRSVLLMPTLKLADYLAKRRDQALFGEIDYLGLTAIAKCVIHVLVGVRSMLMGGLVPEDIVPAANPCVISESSRLYKRSQPATLKYGNLLLDFEREVVQTHDRALQQNYRGQEREVTLVLDDESLA